MSNTNTIKVTKMVPPNPITGDIQILKSEINEGIQCDKTATERIATLESSQLQEDSIRRKHTPPVNIQILTKPDTETEVLEYQRKVKFFIDLYLDVREFKE